MSMLAARKLSWRARARRTDARLLFVPAAAAFALAFPMVHVGIELERLAYDRGVQADRAAQDARDEAQYADDLRDEDRDYGAAHIAAQRRLLARMIGPETNVVQFVVDGYGGLIMNVRQHGRSVQVFADDPDNFGDYRSRTIKWQPRRLTAADLDPQAPLKVVHGAEALSPDGRGMGIDSLTFGESPARDGRLIWTLVADSDPPATYYADRLGDHVALSRPTS